MGATLRLDRFQLLWYLEGAARGSHLRWDVYPTFVNDVFPQLREDERECIYTYAKRDLSEMFKRKQDSTESEYFRQLLARFNPANQYVVTLKDGKKKEIADNAYIWNGKYYVGWQRFCGEEFIVKVEQKSFNKCRNEWCKRNKECIRHITYEDGDRLTDDGHNFFCQSCDLFIADNEIQNGARQDVKKSSVGNPSTDDAKTRHKG